MTDNVREMTFDEEYEILIKEEHELFATEKVDCEPPFANCVVRRALRCISKLLAEVIDYNAIGTVEECRIAMERMRPRNIVRPKGLLNEYYHEEECPNCKTEFGVHLAGYRYTQVVGETHHCPNCGQRLDWSE